MHWQVNRERLDIGYFLVVMVFVAVCGCGGGSGKGSLSRNEQIAELRKKEAAEDAAKTAKLDAEQQAKKQILPPVAPVRARATVVPVHREADPEPAEAKRSKHPANVAEWKKKDYETAVQEHDPNVMAAIAHLSERADSRPDAAELLVSIVQAMSTGRSADAIGRGPLAASGLIDVIAKALAVNGTPPAWQALEQLAAGELGGVDSSVGRAAAVKALLECSSQKSDEVLLRILLAEPPDPFSNRQAASRATSRDSVLTLVKEKATPYLRQRLAESIVAGNAPAGAFERYWSCLEEALPQNVPAQVVVYQADRVDPEIKTALEKRFSVQAAAVVDRLLKIPTTKDRKVRAAAADISVDPKLATASLWNAEFNAAVEQRLAMIEKINQSGDLVALASAIPRPSMHEALVRSLKLHWDEGPASLEKLGASAEPGVLIVLKMLPPKKTAARVTSAGVTKTSKSAMLKARQDEDKNANRWSECAEHVLKAMCDRLCLAAVADVEVDEVSIKPHPGAEVVAAYRSDWPEDCGDEMVCQPPVLLRVRYVRIEQLDRPSRIAAYYRRQLPGAQEHVTKDDFWLESLTRAGNGAWRSVDVLMTKPKDNVPGAADQEQRVLVELVTVECPENTAKTADAKK
jgi:hypothetical protein